MYPLLIFNVCISWEGTKFPKPWPNSHGNIDEKLSRIQKQLLRGNLLYNCSEKFLEYNHRRVTFTKATVLPPVVLLKNELSQEGFDVNFVDVLL